jgi:hypothetical protein
LHLSSSFVSMVMRSPCAGDDLDPPLWKKPNKAVSLSRARVGSRARAEQKDFQSWGSNI